MKVNRILRIQDGDAIDTFQRFLTAWWDEAGLEAMLAPVELADQSGVLAKEIEKPAELARVNPFAPVMLSNAASAVKEFISGHPKGRLAVLLRPCELRALVELQKRGQVPLLQSEVYGRQEDIVIVGVDCLATFPKDEYAMRANLHGVRAITLDVLSSVDEEWLTHQDLRTSCRVCDEPAPHDATVLIGAIGVASEGYFLIIARDEETDMHLRLAEVADEEAGEQEVAQRELALGSVIRNRIALREKLTATENGMFGDLCSILGCLAHCTLCADCLDACPIYEGELSGMLGVGFGGKRSYPILSELIGVSRWLASCSGCGMCEQACEKGVSLTLLMAALSTRVRAELKYVAGDPAQRLPWARH
jgi:formate dehydrogenase subunit beta